MDDTRVYSKEIEPPFLSSIHFMYVMYSGNYHHKMLWNFLHVCNTWQVNEMWFSKPYIYKYFGKNPSRLQSGLVESFCLIRQLWQNFIFYITQMRITPKTQVYQSNCDHNIYSFKQDKTVLIHILSNRHFAPLHETLLFQKLSKNFAPFCSLMFTW